VTGIQRVELRAAVGWESIGSTGWYSPWVLCCATSYDMLVILEGCTVEPPDEMLGKESSVAG
jgi:hypothetical protein